MENLYTQIRHLMDDSNYNEALKMCEEALINHPDDSVLKNFKTDISLVVDNQSSILKANDNEPFLKEMFGEYKVVEDNVSEGEMLKLLETRYKEDAEHLDALNLFALCRQYHEHGCQITNEDLDFLGLIYELSNKSQISYLGIYMDRINLIDYTGNQLTIRFKNNERPDYIHDLYNQIYEESSKIISRMPVSWQNRETTIPVRNIRFTFLTSSGTVCTSGPIRQMCDEAFSLTGGLTDLIFEMQAIVIDIINGNLKSPDFTQETSLYVTQTGAKHRDIVIERKKA